MSTDVSRRAKVMHAQFKRATSEPNEFIKFHMEVDNPSTWYILVGNFSGNEDEYSGGEYLFKMIAPDDFPHNPPSFYAMTPNGLYEINQKVCISIGEYHKNNYRSVLGMQGFARELVNGLIGWREMGGGINIIGTTSQEKAVLAKKSRVFNLMSNADVMNKINTSYTMYKAEWKDEIRTVDAATSGEATTSK